MCTKLSLGFVEVLLMRCLRLYDTLMSININGHNRERKKSKISFLFSTEFVSDSGRGVAYSLKAETVYHKHHSEVSFLDEVFVQNYFVVL